MRASERVHPIYSNWTTLWLLNGMCACLFNPHDRVCMRPVSVFSSLLATTVVFASLKRISSELQLTTRVVLYYVKYPTAHSPSTLLLYSSVPCFSASLPHIFHIQFNSFTPFQPDYGSLLWLWLWLFLFPSLFWYVCILLCSLYFSGFIDTVCTFSYTRVK